MTCLIAYHDGDETDERQRGWQTRLAAYLPDCQLVPLDDKQQMMLKLRLFGLRLQADLPNSLSLN